MDTLYSAAVEAFGSRVVLLRSTGPYLSSVTLTPVNVTFPLLLTTILNFTGSKDKDGPGAESVSSQSVPFHTYFSMSMDTS